MTEEKPTFPTRYPVSTNRFFPVQRKKKQTRLRQCKKFARAYSATKSRESELDLKSRFDDDALMTFRDYDNESNDKNVASEYYFSTPIYYLHFFRCSYIQIDNYFK